MEQDREFLLGLVCREHGHRAVRFALSVDDDSPLTGVAWTPGREEVLQLLLGGLMVADLQHESEFRGSGNAVFGYWHGTGDSLLRGMRALSGGDLPSVEEHVSAASSHMAQHLQRLIGRYELDIQTQLSMSDWRGGRGVPSTYGDLDGQALLELLLNDEAAAPLEEALAASSKARSGIRHCMLLTSEAGGSLQESMIPEHLLNACVTRTLVQGQPLTAASMSSHAEAVVSDFLKLVSGRPVRVPVAIGALGSRLVGSAAPGGEGAVSDGDRVPVGDGYLRPPTPMDRRLFTMAMEPVGLVWVTDQQTQAKVLLATAATEDSDLMSTTWEEIRPGNEGLDDRWDLVAQAIVLAAPNYPPPAWTISEFFVTSVVAPHERSSSKRGIAVGESSSTAITTAEFAEFADIARWRGLLSEHPEALPVSRSRLVSALASRPDPVDALVDAVVAWEGIFSGTPETLMRTVLPSCKVLASDTNPAELLKAMKDVYRLRSSLVHGSAPKKTKQSDIRAAQEKALRWVIALLQKLFADRPDLLELSASERSEAVLLPGSHPTSER